MLLTLERRFDQFANLIGTITAFAIVLMILNVTYDVVARYFFSTGSIAMQEMEWHLFSVVILLGISYTLKEDGHVRVDLIYDRCSPKRKALINMVGVVLFIFPISIIVKALIPLSFLLLIITSIGYFIKNLNVYKGLHGMDDYNLKAEIEPVKKELNEHKHHIVDIDEKGDEK
jgi:TRAP-type mannitol/chloroaromatic compound transport system permease small subunit